MSIARSESGLTLIGTGSLTSTAPAKIFADVRPPNVNGRTAPAWTVAPCPRGAIAAAPISSGAVPNTLLKTTRTRSPPIVVWTICRSVWLLTVSGGGPGGGPPGRGPAAAAPAGGAVAVAGAGAAGAASGVAAAGAAGAAGGAGRTTSAVAQVPTQCSWALRWLTAGNAAASAMAPTNNARRNSRGTRAAIDMGPPARSAADAQR